MAKLGKQPPRYNFFFNPYQDARFTRCPQCGEKTRQRKLPLIIFVEPRLFIALNKTCRYCPRCDLLIAHQDEVEEKLAIFVGQQAPQFVGNYYLVVGTIDRDVWRRGVREALELEGLMENLHDFKQVLRFEVAYGWGKE